MQKEPNGNSEEKEKEAGYETGPGEEQVVDRALYLEVIDETNCAIHPADEGDDDSSLDTATSNQEDNDVTARMAELDDNQWMESIIVELLQDILIRGDK